MGLLLKIHLAEHLWFVHISVCYTSIFKNIFKKQYKNNYIYICHCGAEFCDMCYSSVFRVKSLPLLFWEMNPLTVLFQVVKKFSQKFLRKLFIIFISEGCAYFSFKEISNLFQTGNCWGNEIRLFRMLMQLDSSGVVPWCASQFVYSAHVLLWELPPLQAHQCGSFGHGCTLQWWCVWWQLMAPFDKWETNS